MPVPVRAMKNDPKIPPNSATQGLVPVPNSTTSQVVFKPPTPTLRPAPLNFSDRKEEAVISKRVAVGSGESGGDGIAGRPNILRHAFVDKKSEEASGIGIFEDSSGSVPVICIDNRGSGRGKAVTGFSRPRSILSERSESLSDPVVTSGDKCSAEESVLVMDKSARPLSFGTSLRSLNESTPRVEDNKESRPMSSTSTGNRVHSAADKKEKEKHTFERSSSCNDTKTKSVSDATAAGVSSAALNRPHSLALGGHAEESGKKVRALSGNMNEKIKQLMILNAADDESFDLQNEMIDAAACRPVSRTCNLGALFMSQSDFEYHCKYESDSTDTDESDDMTIGSIGSGFYSDADVEDVNDIGIGMGDIESNGGSTQPQRPPSRRKTRSQRNTPGESDGDNSASSRPTSPSSRASPSPKEPTTHKVKKTKKAKLERRKRQQQQKAKQRASASSDDQPRVMTEREKSVARYRATLERIDRKLRKEGFGEEIKCVDGE